MIKQKFLVQFGSTIFLKIVAMLAGIVVARIAGPEVVGTIAFGTAYVSVWGFINGLFSTGHIKLVSEGRDLGKCVSTYSWLQGGSILVFSIIVAGWFLMQKFILNYPFESAAQQTVILILLFAYIASLLLDFNNVTFTARLEQAKANYPLFVQSIVWQTGRVIVVLLGFRAVGLATWNLTVSILVLPLAWRLYKQLPQGGFDKGIAREYLSYVPPVAMIVIVNSILNYSDKLLLTHYTSVTELGYYSAAFAIGGMFLLVSKATGQIFFPLFSQMITKNNWDGVNQKINSFQDFAGLFIFPLICVVFIAGEPFLIAILGERYQPSVIPFKILLFATYISIVGMPYGNIISGMGRFYLNALIHAIQLVVFIISITFFLSPRFLNLGAIGLAFNLLTVNIAGNLMYMYFSHKKGELRLRFIPSLRYLIAGSIIGLLFMLKALLNIGDTFASLIILSTIFLIMIYGVFILTGLINKKHLLLLLDMLKVKSVFNYIRDEISNKNEN